MTGSGERGVSREVPRSAPQEHLLLRTAARVIRLRAASRPDNDGIAYEQQADTEIRKNRLAGIVAGTALAGGEDKWYQDSARLLSYNVLKSGPTGQREQTTHLHRAELNKRLPPEVVKVIAEHAPDGTEDPFAMDAEKV